MPSMTPPLKKMTLSVLALTVFLAACDTAEERAEGHYESALELLEQGDVARAKVELRTVFSLVPDHIGARETFARVLLEEGERGAAFGQYMRLVEQTPDALEPRLVVAELLMLETAFDDAREHLEAALRIAPEDPQALILANTMAYRDAVLAEDVEARRAAGSRAMELVARVPDSIVNNSVVADSLLLDQEYDTLLVELDRIQEIIPEERRFYQLRLTGYVRMGDAEGIERTIREMIDAFPEDEGLPATLMRFYSSRGDLDGAEEFLRSRITEGVADDGARLSLIRFLAQARSPEEALAEAERRVAEGTNDEFYRSVEASLRYDLGQRDRALDIFNGIIERSVPSDQLNDIKSTYARLLLSEGNEVGARALVEEILTDDPAHVASLLMRATWLIEDDRADEAILALRVAQDQDPENPVIFTQLAEAHLRNGERNLAGEMLALAVETSNRAPRESIVYARFLAAEDRLKPAEAILIDALRLAPGTIDLLSELASIYIRLEDWGRAGDIERELREIGSPVALELASRVQLATLQAQGRSDEAVAFLQDLESGTEAESTLGRQLAIAQTLLRDGDAPGAVAHLQGLLEQDPANPTIRFFLGNALSANAQFDEAAQTFRALIDEGATGDRVWVGLIRALNLAGRSQEAEAALQDALAAAPDAPDLKWILASQRERAGDFEGAIAIYEELYEINSNSAIVANNLASLLSTNRTDEASLDRAERIARRLRDTDVPAFQDTYGWIQYLRGNYSEAVTYLTPAAAALQNDALVQAHLGLALAELARTDDTRRADALAQLERALEAGADDPRPAFQLARERLAELQNGDTTE